MAFPTNYSMPSGTGLSSEKKDKYSLYRDAVDAITTGKLGDAVAAEKHRAFFLPTISENDMPTIMLIGNFGHENKPQEQYYPHKFYGVHGIVLHLLRPDQFDEILNGHSMRPINKYSIADRVEIDLSKGAS